MSRTVNLPLVTFVAMLYFCARLKYWMKLNICWKFLNDNNIFLSPSTLRPSEIFVQNHFREDDVCVHNSNFKEKPFNTIEEVISC